MKIKRVGVFGYDIYYVASEPKDNIKLKFIIYRESDLLFRFMGLEGTRFLPARLSRSSVENHNLDVLAFLAVQTNSTTEILKECFKVMKFIIKEDS